MHPKGFGAMVCVHASCALWGVKRGVSILCTLDQGNCVLIKRVQCIESGCTCVLCTLSL